MKKKSLIENFFTIYGNRNNQPVLFFSPGRVNLIGEHTDYNGGFVFPCALNFGTYLAIRKTDDNKLKFHTINFDRNETIDVSSSYISSEKKWVNYPLGVVNEFARNNIRITGLEFLFSGDVPNNAGLSSSASIEMVTAVALNDLFKSGLPLIDLVKMSQRAENKFVGMNCGIMDQFAVGFGKEDHAIFLNCDTLIYEYVPLKLKDHSLIIANTNKKRGLTDSKYNERVAECKKAVELLQPYKKISNLSELNSSEIDLLNKYIEDPVVIRRARHIISENGRTKEAVRVLRKNNIQQFGELMNQSHDSLKNDYEVTGFELDTLVYEARKQPGVAGTRMTGAGFGGCTVSIVEKKYSESFIKKLGKAYSEITGLVADFYLPEIGDGVRKMG